VGNRQQLAIGHFWQNAKAHKNLVESLKVATYQTRQLIFYL